MNFLTRQVDSFLFLEVWLFWRKTLWLFIYLFEYLKAERYLGISTWIDKKFYPLNQII